MTISREDDEAGAQDYDGPTLDGALDPAADAGKLVGCSILELRIGEKKAFRPAWHNALTLLFVGSTEAAQSITRDFAPAAQAPRSFSTRFELPRVQLFVPECLSPLVSRLLRNDSIIELIGAGHRNFGDVITECPHCWVEHANM